MQIVYNGVHPEVVVDEFSQSVIKAGEPVEMPDDLAARLLEQSTWSKASTPAPQSSTPTSAQSAPVADPAAASASASTDATKGNS